MPTPMLTPVLVHAADMSYLRTLVEPLDANNGEHRDLLQRDGDARVVGCVVTEDWLARFDAACRTMRELAEEAAAQPRYQVVRVTRVKLGDEIFADTEHPSARRD